MKKRGQQNVPMRAAGDSQDPEVEDDLKNAYPPLDTQSSFADFGKEEEKADKDFFDEEEKKQEDVQSIGNFRRQ